MTYKLPLLLALAASPALAAEPRGLDAHVHGLGSLDIAIDGTRVAMELTAPGADIVGFEHTAKSAEDRAAIDAAVAILAKPLDLFVMPGAAGCSVVQASAALESDDALEDHADDHDHAHAHDDHDHDHAHDDHDHAEASGEHTEFHAKYMLTCNMPDALDEIRFAYFDQFAGAEALEVQIVSSKGAQAFDVDRNDPTLDLRGMF